MIIFYSNFIFILTLRFYDPHLFSLHDRNTCDQNALFLLRVIIFNCHQIMRHPIKNCVE